MKRYALCVWLFLSLPLAHAATITAVTEDAPPYNYLQNGQMTGFSTEVVQALLKTVGLDYELHTYPWARAYSMAQRRPNVLIYSIIRSPERENLFKWVGQIAPRRAYFYKLASRSDIQIHNLQDAKRYHVGAVLDDARSQFLTQQGFDVRDVVPTDSDNLRKLHAGRIDLIIANELALPYLAQQEGFDTREFEPAYFLQEFSSLNLYLAFSKTTPDALVERYRAALDQFKASREYELIHSKYLPVHR